jgi:hypothetical protein
VTVQRISATARVTAPASRIFQIVSHPDGHVQIDGSGMLQSAPDAQPITTAGQTFDMQMDREPLGDRPEMGRYTVRNTVVQLIPDRLVEWTVGRLGDPPRGHIYGWAVEPVSETDCDVTNYCDWSGVVETAAVRFPIVPLYMLEKSVDNLRRIAQG